MAELTFDDLPEAKAEIAFDDLPDASHGLKFDDLPDVASTSKAPDDVATPLYPSVPSGDDNASLPVGEGDAQPLISKELAYPADLQPGIPQEIAPASSAAANAVRSIAGGAAGGVADIVGGIAGLAASPGRDTQADIVNYTKRISDLSKKPSVYDDFTNEQLQSMTTVPEGYRTPQEEAEITLKRAAVDNLRGVAAGERGMQSTVEGIQDLASAASKESQTFFGQDPQRQDEFLSKLATGAGSLPPYILSAMVGGPVLSMLVGSLQTGQNEYNAAVQSGHPELANEAMAKGMSIGLTEGAGVGGGAGKAASSFGKKALATLLKGFEEGGQEWVQQTLSNLNANTFTGYNPQQGTFEGSGEAGAIGLLLGGGAEAIHQVSQRTGARPAVVTAAADLSAVAESASESLPLAAKVAEQTAADVIKADGAKAPVSEPLPPPLSTAEMETRASGETTPVESLIETPSPSGVAPEAALTTPEKNVGAQPLVSPAGRQLSPTRLDEVEAELADEVPEAASDVAEPVRIAGPALIDADGKVVAQGTIGQTHADLKIAAARQGEDVTDATHAFLDNQGNVLNREQAGEVAKAAQQRIEGTSGPLQSEHLQVESPASALPEPAANYGTAKSTPVTPVDVQQAQTILDGVLPKEIITKLGKLASIKMTSGEGMPFTAVDGETTINTDALARALSSVEGEQAKIDYVVNGLDEELTHQATLKALKPVEINNIGKNLTADEREVTERLYGAKMTDYQAGAEAVRLFIQGSKGNPTEAYKLFTDKAKRDPAFRTAIEKVLAYVKDLASRITDGALSKRLTDGIIRTQAVLDGLNTTSEESAGEVDLPLAAKALGASTPEQQEFVQSVGKPAMRNAVKAIRAAQTDGGSAQEAIAAGMESLRANVEGLDEAAAQAYFDSLYEPQTTQETPAQEPASTPEPETTATYNAETDKLLKKMGFEPLVGPGRKALGTSWDEAQKEVQDDPGKGARLVEELNRDPRALKDDVENGVLLHELANRKAEQAKAQAALFDAVRSEDPEAIGNAQERLTKARDATFDAITAAKATGTAWGRSGRFRQVHIDQDYSLTAMEAAWRGEANGGKPLTEDQSKMIADLHARIEASERRIAEFEAKEADTEAKRVFDQVLKDAKKEAQVAKKSGNRVTTFLNQQAAEARKRIIARRGKLFATVDLLNIAGLIDETIIGADHIASGLTKFADWSGAMLEDFGERLRPVLPKLFENSKAYHDAMAAELDATDTRTTPESITSTMTAGEPLEPKTVFDLARAHVNAGVVGMENVMKAVHADLLPLHENLTEREVRDAFSGYGKVTFPSREADLTALREYKNLARLQSQLEDAQKKIAPLKTGPQRDKATQAVRDLTKQVRETMRSLGIETTTPEQQLKTSLDAVKTRLQNQIEDLTKQIATRTKPEGKTPIPYDEQATALKTERDRLAQLAEEIFGKPELTDAQRIATATKALDRSIAEEDALLKAGILKRPAKGTKAPQTPELEAKRAMLDSMRDLRNELADAEIVRATPEQKQVAALEKRAAELREQIAAGDTARKASKQTVDTKEVAAAKAEVERLNGEIQKLREKENPKPTAEERALAAATKAAKESIDHYDEILKSGTLTPSEKAARFTPSAELETLWNERNALREAVQEMRKEATPRTSPEEMARKTAIKALDKRLAELDRRLKEGDFSDTPKKEGKASQFADVQSKRAEAAALRDLWTKLKKAALPKRSEEEVRLSVDKKAIARRTEELQRRVREGDYAPKVKKEPLMDVEKNNLLFENAKAKEAFNRGLFEERLKNRGVGAKIFDTARETLNTSRAILTSMDLSGVLRQGGFIALGHPVRAATSIVPMLRAFGSEKAAFKVDQEIKNRPNAPLYEQSKLFLSDQENISLTKMEEAFMSRIANKIPLVAGSQRAYSTFLNKLRADSFDAMAKTLAKGGKVTPVEAKVISNFINVATGRASIPGAAAQAAATLNSVFFAPRYVASRFQLLAGQPLYQGNARTRKLIAGEYARYLIGVGLVYALAMAAQDDKDPAIELNPTSSDFLKVRFGNTRLDPMSGLLQATVFAAREGEALRRFATQDVRKDPKYGSGGDVLGRFLRSKLAPAIGTVVDALAGKDVTGQKVTPLSSAQRAVVPLSFGDILKTMDEQGVAKGTALSLLSLLGMGVQTYERKK